MKGPRTQQKQKKRPRRTWDSDARAPKKEEENGPKNPQHISKGTVLKNKNHSNAAANKWALKLSP